MGNFPDTPSTVGKDPSIYGTYPGDWDAVGLPLISPAVKLTIPLEESRRDAIRNISYRFEEV